MKILKKLFILLCALIVLNVSPKICRAESTVNINTSYGIEGKFKGNSLTINVQLENTSNSSIDGQLQVRVPISSKYYDSYSVDVNLSPNEKREVSIPIYLVDGEVPRIKVVFLQDDEIISEKKLTISSGRINDYSMFMGILTDDYNGVLLKDIDLSQANNVYYENQNLYSIALNKELLTNSRNIESLDVIVINNYNTANLTKDNYNSLNEWINGGGVLIIGTGENSSKTIGNMEKDFLNLFYDENVISESISSNKVITKEVGSGAVYIAPYDFSNGIILNDVNTNLYWINTLSEAFIRTSHLNYDYNYMYTNLLNQVPNTEMYSTGTLVMIFSIYTLLIGIIIYFIFKKIKKTEYLWFAIPLIAVVFTGIIFLIGNKTRLKDVALNQVSVIKKDKTGGSISEAYVGVTPKYKGDLSIKDPKEGSIELLSSYDDYYYSDSTNDADNLRAEILYSGSNVFYEYNDLPALTTKNFKVKNTNVTVPNIDYNLTYLKDGIRGSVKNTLDCNIKKLLIVATNNIWDLGKVKSGEEINVDSVKVVNSDLGSYANNIMYGTAYPNKNDIWENRVSGVLSAIYEESLIEDSIYLIAITDMPIDYKFDFDGKSISKYDTTAIIQEIEMNFADDNGNSYFPWGYFGARIISTDVNDIYNNLAYGSGDIYLEYEIDKGIDVTTLSVGYTSDEFKYSYNSPLNGSVYIYNYSTYSYEEIEYKEGGVNIQNVKDYIDDNKVLIHVSCKNEDNVKLPQIAVEGVKLSASN